MSIPPPGPPPAVLPRRRVLAAGLALTAGGAPACAGRTTRRERIAVRLGIVAGTQTLWRHLVLNSSLLSARGYTPQFGQFSNEEQLLAGYRAGTVDAVATLLPALPALAETGAPARLFLPIAWLREGYPIVALAEGPVRSLADLRAGRLATYPLSHPGLGYWRALLLANHGVRLETLRLVQVASPEEALADGRADVAVMSSTQWASLRQESALRKIGDLQTEWQRLTGSDRLPVFAGYLARPDFLTAHPRFAPDMIDAHVAALTAYKNGREAFLRAISGNPAGLPELTRDENAFIATYLGYDDVDVGRLRLSDADVADATQLFRFLASAGFLQRPPADAAGLFYRPP